jgi:hypothetical protein
MPRVYHLCNFTLKLVCSILQWYNYIHAMVFVESCICPINYLVSSVICENESNVCALVDACTCVRVHVPGRTCLYVHMYEYVRVSEYVCAHVWVCAYVCVCACIWVCVCMFVRVVVNAWNSLHVHELWTNAISVVSPFTVCHITTILSCSYTQGTQYNVLLSFNTLNYKVFVVCMCIEMHVNSLLKYLPFSHNNLCTILLIIHYYSLFHVNKAIY